MSDSIDDRLERLESLVEAQQDRIEEQRERIENQRARIDELETHDDRDPARTISRRGALAGGALALLGVGSGTAGADPRGRVGRSGDPLAALYTEEIDGGVTGGNRLRDLTGRYLSIDGQRLNFAEPDLLDFGSTTGVIAENFAGLSINAPNSGEVTVPAGSGYVADAATGRTRFVEWSESVLGPFAADSAVSIGVDNTGTPTAGVGTTPETILFGEVLTDSSQRIAILKDVPYSVDHDPTRLERVFRLAIRNVVDAGLLVTENPSNPGKLDVTPGTYVFGTNIYEPAGGTQLSWGAYFLDSSNELALEGESFDQDTVPAKYNVPGSSTPLRVIPAGEFARHAFYVVGDGTTERFVLLYGRSTYSSITNAREGGLPARPQALSKNVALVASIIVDDSGGIAEIVDEREFAPLVPDSFCG